MPLLSINVFIFVIIYKLPTSMNISIDVCVSVLGSECVAQYVYSYLFVYIRTHSFSILYSRYVSMSVSFVSLSFLASANCSACFNLSILKSRARAIHQRPVTSTSIRAYCICCSIFHSF
jgi:hypothetical protein